MVNTSNSKTEINTFNVLGNPHSMPLWTSSCSYTIAPPIDQRACAGGTGVLRLTFR